MGNLVQLEIRRAKESAPAKRRVKLTKRVVDATQPHPDQDIVIFDTELPGFCVRVKPSGVKSYAIQYRNADGRSRRMTLGKHSVLTTEEARNQARQQLAATKRGFDPLADKRARRAKAAAAQTVRQLMDRYLGDYAEVRKKPSSVKEDRRLIDRRIKPAIGALLIDSLTREHVVDLHHQLRATPFEANRTIALLSKALGLAEVWGLRPQGSNPCRYVERYSEKARDRFYSDAELASIGTALREAETTGTESSGVILAIRLLALTGCRLGEVLSLRWDDVDLETGVLRLPDAKAGARLVPLGDAALQLLSKAPRDGLRVIHYKSSTAPLPTSTVEGAWSRIKAKAGVENARLHDLRRTVGTIAGQHGWNAFTVKTVMGHKTLSMTDRYVVQDVGPIRRAANDVSRRISAALTNEPAGQGRVNRRRRRQESGR